MRWLWLLAGGAIGAVWSRRRASPQPLEEAPATAESKPAEPSREQLQHLEELADCSREQALQLLFQEVRTRHQQEIASYSRQDWEQLAAQKLVESMQRLVISQAETHCLSTLELPAEDYKGRIIGKEGRNLRLFEQLTGVEILLDDGPHQVTLSCFDPGRREVARLAMQKLLEDGRFQPSRIESAVTWGRSQLAEGLLERARQAARQAEISGLRPELLQALGQLWLRTSYRQNVLLHSVEVAWLAARLASELGLDPEVARRAGLLHDLGKGVQGSTAPHALVGAELCRRWGESPEVCHAVEAHHEDVPPQSLYPTLIQVADAISAARPGARKENAEVYLERLTGLEELGRSLPGVMDCQVLQAGREIRVFVRPESVDDKGCMELAQELARQIEAAAHLKPPGPVRIKVLRQHESNLEVA